MEEKIFYLMHQNDLVCSISVDVLSGNMLRVSKPFHPELLPPGGCIDSNTLRKWWQRRAVPISQGKIREVLNHLGIATPQEYLLKNLGLSLNDHYWIKPIDLNLDWQDINLFTNDFREPAGNLLFTDPIFPNDNHDIPAFSPSSSTQGNLRKKWIIVDGIRCLVKSSHGSNSQESLNEIAASVLHSKQSKEPFVKYEAMPSGNSPQIYCLCGSFTSITTEFIPAIDVVSSSKKDNATSMYEHFIQICASHGLEANTVRSFLEYQILSDFVLTNTDRHLNNFGILRDTNTLKWIGMAPIFDTGNSMFWDNSMLPTYNDLTNISVNSFRSTEKKLLQLVQKPDCLDIAKLPTLEELRSIYETDPMISGIDSILLGYRKKIERLEKYNP